MLRSPRWHRRVAWAVGIWLLVWALAYVAVPLLVKSQLERLGFEKLGRRVSVGSVDFRPWSLELTVHDLAVAKAGPAAAEPASPQAVPQLKIRRLYIDAELASLLRLAPVADALAVEEPALSLTYFGQGRYDIDGILERLKTAEPQPAGDGARFALYNLVLSGGRVDVADESVHATHSLHDLHLAVPFLSNLPSQREIKTAPRLAFVLNGSRFDTAAVATPFAPTRQTDATLQLRDLDLQPYLAYWPDSLPFRLQSAVLQADIQLAFEQNPAPSLKISGSVTAGKVRLLEARPPGSAPGAGPELLAFDRLHLVLDDVRPLEQLVKLSAVELGAPLLSVTRDRAGRLNLLPAGQPVATKSVAASSRPASGEGQNDAKNQAATTSAQPWRIQVDSVDVKGGALDWRDESLPSPARIRLKDLTLNATSIAFPFADNAPLQFSGSLGLAPSMPASLPVQVKTAARSATKPQVAVAAVPPSSPPTATLFTFKGSATDTAANATATVSAWPLDMAAKYVGQFLLPALSGRLDADIGLTWRAAQAGKPQALRIIAPALALSDVQLAQGGDALVSVQRAELAGVDIDLPGQSFSAASLQLGQPRAKVERDAGKRWMVERWLVAREPSAAAPAAASAKPAAPSWAVAIDEVVLDGGAMSFSDKAGDKPVAFEVTAANARLGALVLGDRPAGRKQAAQAMPLSASLRLASGRFAPGKLDFKGDLALAPLQAKGQLAVERLPVQAFEPYFAGALNIELLRADASFKGRVAYRDTAAGPQAEVAGDAALESFSANTLAPAEELLAWKSLNVRGLKVALEPARPTRVDVRETVLSDFFARVIILPDGRINLQDLVKPATTGAGKTPADATKNIAENAIQTSGNGLKNLKNPEIAAAAPSGPKPVINFGPISLLNGQVRFSDRFVKPNYSADLSELTGTLSAFSSVAPATPANGAAAAPAMADLELRGKAEGSASLEITGKLNPLVTPLALDITGKVRDLELPPLSPYAIKYAGYGIERGKMSVDVNYVVLPNGQLTAKNKLVLNQLSFGDKAEGSTASLPVKLAVALLADRNGVIDLDLPISGSLNDPQFSLGPVIVKVILNVITKAITAPFSLLARALGGGGDELATVNFAAGSAQLSPDARAGLDKVAKALAERPALQLTVVGTGSLDAERDAYQREQLAERVRAEKRRQQGGAATEAASVGADEYPALLKAVYRQSELPKPRNLVGLARDLPVGEMEKLLLSGIAVSAEDLRQLAVKRGQAVKDYLVSRDLPPARLFLGAAKAVPPDAKWTPHAELNLAMP
ncbi:DUF748 domain-containing protein [Polaromonas glacialis]|uniref:DUF748 domain-containing protein n=1 Tax=Polaromonas glacialis TaxID=866564 RepID=UPI002FBE3F4E